MSKTFRAWDVDQVWLLPPSVHDFVPTGHPAHLVRELVREELDLSAIVAAYEREERGQPPYHPAMMVALLLYAYTQGVYASRRIAKACEERLDVMAVTGMQRPDFRTISDFRKRHLEALAALFVQVLQLCRQAGLVKLGHVALDGTKIKANASKHKAMSYGRMARAEAELAAEVAGWLAQAEAADAAEDAAHGPDRRGDELPAWVADKQARLERIRVAKAALEAEAEQPPPEDAEPGPSSGMTDHGRPRRLPGRVGERGPNPALTGQSDGGPPARAQHNFTDPDSRVLKTRDGFVQGYNGQLAVDAGHQIIIAQRLTTNGSDQAGLVPLLDATTAALGRTPREVSADAGFCRETNLAALAARKIRGYLAPGRASHGASNPSGHRRLAPGSRMAAMAARLKRAGPRSRYRLRKQTVEPVIGQIKQARGFRQFLLRGFRKVEAEWALICTTHNLTKLVAARTPRAA
jgi:transposase